MQNKMIPGLLNIILIFLFFSCTLPQKEFRPELRVTYQNNKAQIETGNTFVGIEMHGGQPLLNRISFFYPKANSIDRSEDYWRRGQWKIFDVALKIDNGPFIWLDSLEYEVNQTPYYVDFNSTVNNIEITVGYHFCESSPVMSAELTFKNKGNSSGNINVYSQMLTILRTSHSYNLVNPEYDKYVEKYNASISSFDDTGTGEVQLFVMNTDEPPVSHGNFFIPSDKFPIDSLSPAILSGKLDEISSDDHIQSKPGSAFLYKNELLSGESLRVNQLIGTCTESETDSLLTYLTEHYNDEITSHEKRISDKLKQQPHLKLSDPWFDHSVDWARAILEVNRHYLDGNIVPMPCPAEYNFFFSHDVLVTDLAAVYFDPERVKNDLRYIVSKADSTMRIPHAYYWKDDHYLTEYAGTDNWNNMWMIITSAAYLRHTADHAFIRELFPILQNCLKLILVNKGSDDLIWSSRPDWWDIGNNFGPRTYMTILAIRALRDYIFISSYLGEKLNVLPEYEMLADRMKQQLIRRLWNTDQDYLLNEFADGSVDQHYYIGSLLAAHFGLVDSLHARQMISTAKEKLLDPKCGIYNAFPMDFRQWRDYLKFAGDEAGAPWYYFNGGIWPQGNAWYTLALIRSGQWQDALDFIRIIMTVKGIMGGPNGQPGMYEVRMAPKDNSEVYGTIDKPQFMWAAAWYLYSLYNLIGFDDSSWNIRFNKDAPLLTDSYEAEIYAAGKKLHLERKYPQNLIPVIKDGTEILPSCIVPLISKNSNLSVSFLSEYSIPVLVNCNSILSQISWNKEERELSLELLAFKSKADSVMIQYTSVPENLTINNKANKDWQSYKKGSKNIEIVSHFIFDSDKAEIRIKF